MSITMDHSPQIVRDLVTDSPWVELKEACIDLQAIQAKDGSVAKVEDHSRARKAVETITGSVATLAPWFPHDAEYLDAVARDCAAWESAGFWRP